MPLHAITGQPRRGRSTVARSFSSRAAWRMAVSDDQGASIHEHARCSPGGTHDEILEGLYEAR